MEQKPFIEQIKQAAVNVKDFLTKYSTLVLIVLGALAWALWTRRGNLIEQLQLRVRGLLLEKELAKLEGKRLGDEEAFHKYNDRYNALKREHADITERLGL